MKTTPTKERPILMSAPMVRACLRDVDPKTQTRRKMNPQPVASRCGGQPMWGHRDLAGDFGESVFAACASKLIPCPYGQSGDRLWVKETWATSHRWDSTKPSELPGGEEEGCPIYYRECDDDPVNTSRDGGIIQRWRPSIFMPRWASRITLEIVSVRVERLQEISEADAVAEGWVKQADRSDNPEVHRDAARDWYSDLWESINGPGSWAINPWVWVVAFLRCDATPAAAIPG